MRAVFCRAYGGPEVVTIEEAPKPVAGPGEILVRIRASTVSAADRRLRALDVPRGFGLPMRLAFGWSRLRQPILGGDLAGIVEAVGEGVTRFSVGDAVLANVGASLGCHAEYRVLKEKAAIIRKPDALSFESAASLVFGGTTALFFLRDCMKIRPGEHVLIHGAGGAVGSAAIQIARAMGATVTAVARAEKHARLRAIGADHLIDYTREAVPGQRPLYDGILDCHGDLGPATVFPALTDKGRFGPVVAGLPDYLEMPFRNLFSTRKIRAGIVGEKAEDLEYLVALARVGRFEPVIGAVFPLEAARAAHEAAAEPRKSGNVVLTMG